MSNRMIILDTETTGLDPSEHRLIEFAGIEMINRKLTGRHLHCYINPQRAIDEGAQRVHGISLDMLANKPVFKDVARDIADFVRDAELIIHNAPFDVGFLNAEFARVGVPSVAELSAEVTDTLRMAKERFPGKRNNLDALCDRYAIDRSNRTVHGALIDCELLADVYFAMTRGQESLLMDLGEHVSHTGLSARLEVRKPLLLLHADNDELAAHAAVLNVLDKKAGGACVWRDYTPDTQ